MAGTVARVTEISATSDTSFESSRRSRPVAVRQVQPGEPVQLAPGVGTLDQRVPGPSMVD